MAGKPQSNPEAMFWSRVDRSGGLDACWPWSGYVAANGYGQAYNNGQSIKAHRRAFALANGWLPKGRTKGSIIVRHTCDNRRCCNPAHLIVGTHRDNVRDMDDRKRRNPPRLRGEANPAVKLGPGRRAMAWRMKAAGHSQVAIAEKLSVSQSSISRLFCGQTFALRSAGQ